MLASVARRAPAVLRDAASSGRDVPRDVLPQHGRRADDEACERASLDELVESVPELHSELRQRGRASALLVGVAAAILLPSWTGFDLLLEPQLVARFGLARVVCAVPMLAALWLLWRRPVGLRHPQLITFAVLTVAQLDIAWMTAQVTHVESYVMGLSLALYGSGCLLSGRPRWTAALVGVTWLSLAGSVTLAGTAMTAQSLTIGSYYLASASIIAVIAHVLRQRVTTRELRARVRLEREQERSRALLARLERLSHEDPLTGLANRRRWDAELGSVCSEARASGATVGLVLVDVDHFKLINDRHGHAGGDAALCSVAELLRSRVRSGDLVARLGGDELAVLMPGADLARTVAVAEAVRAQAHELRLPGAGPGEVTLSIGVAVATGERAFPLELTSCADAQLYRAKITRDCVGAPVAG
jgi:diguanylate cyclase (GGDEF)-like protein